VVVVVVVVVVLVKMMDSCQCQAGSERMAEVQLKEGQPCTLYALKSQRGALMLALCLRLCLYGALSTRTKLSSAFAFWIMRAMPHANGPGPVAMFVCAKQPVCLFWPNLTWK
jgi:hypothetical protein